LEVLLEKSVESMQRLAGPIPKESLELLEHVDRACDELVMPEFEHYVSRKYDEEIPIVLKKHGLLGIPIAKEYGGSGADVLTWTLAMQRFGRLGLGVPTFVDVHSLLCGLLIQQWGSEDQKQRYLRPSARGDIIFAYGLTEPEAGSNPAGLQTHFEERGGSYFLTGTKYLISNGSVADALVTFAYPKGRTDGMCAFILETDTPGFQVEMKLDEKIGLFTSDTAMLRLENCEVPKHNLLGPPGRGLPVAYSGLLNGRVGIAAGCVGVIEDCLTSVRERAQQRVQHGKPIGKHQLIQRHVSRIAMNFEMAKWPTYLSAMKKAVYDREPENLEARKDADLQSAIAKKVASELSFDSADRAVQVFGGFGYSILSPVAKHFLDTRVARIYEGTDEIMELKIAALVLGKEFEAFQ
jgi:alkylation response protein AidB-like acyl-CoA dehydrogenase